MTFMSPKGELARLVEEKGCGWNVTSAEELAGLIRSLLASRNELIRKRAIVREVYTEHFRREKIIDRYAEVILRAIGGHKIVETGA